jgi:hypothetical protein
VQCPASPLRDIPPGISRTTPLREISPGISRTARVCGTSQVYVTLVLVIRFLSSNKIRIPGISRKTPLRENSPGMSRKVSSGVGSNERRRASTNYLSLNQASSYCVAYAQNAEGGAAALSA